MTQRIEISKKIDLLKKPYLTISEIQGIFDIGQLQATNIRNEAIKLADKRKRYYCRYRVPTDLVLEIVGYSIDYFVSLLNLENNKELASIG